jgi:hypothetical protein
MGAHAVLSASSSHRWLVCPPSALLEAEMPDTVSTYAQEGTAAHTFAELLLRRRLGRVTPAAFEQELEALRKKEEFAPYYGPAFVEAVREYTELVMAAARDAADPRDVFLEERVSFAGWVPGGFGTADAIILAEPVIHVIDLKFGVGVPVSAEKNPQLLLYALGAWNMCSCAYELTEAIVTIAQPRLDESSQYRITVKELLDWAESYVRPRAELAARGAGEFAPSEETCRFCRVNAVCRARAEKNLKTARERFKDPPLLTPEETAEILGQATEIKRWADNVQEYALEQARRGVRYPGWKLVEGRSIRVWRDEAAAEDALLKAGLEDIYAPPKMKSLAALEKEIGKGPFAKAVGALVLKPPGKPALAPDEDPRPEFGSTQSAIEAFSD